MPGLTLFFFSFSFSSSLIDFFAKKKKKGCSAILDYIPCSFGDDLFNENVRRLACIWEDRFYAAQITAALINLFVMVVLNKVFEKVAAILNDWGKFLIQIVFLSFLPFF